MVAVLISVQLYSLHACPRFIRYRWLVVRRRDKNTVVVQLNHQLTLKNIFLNPTRQKERSPNRFFAEFDIFLTYPSDPDVLAISLLRNRFQRLHVSLQSSNAA